jgi:site-specific DNA-methyltransferase (adenine-specific)
MAANPEQQRILSAAKPFLVTQHGLLYQTDCVELLARLRDETIDCVFADPPFNIGKDYKNGFKDEIHAERYYAWCREWIHECARVLKPGGSMFLYALPEIAIRFAQFMGERLTFRHWIAVMMKGTYSRGKKLYPAHYGLLYYTKGEPKTFNRVRLPIPVCRHCGGEIRDYGGHRDKLNPEGLNLTDFWDDTSPNRHKKFKVRPGVNELKLMIPERAILISTEPGDLVLDPFGGGGSTYQAAEKHHRNWIGSELYDCHHIQTRLAEGFPLSVRRKPTFAQKSLFQTTNEDNHYTVLRRREG